MATYNVLTQGRAKILAHHSLRQGLVQMEFQVLNQVYLSKGFHTSYSASVNHRKERAIVKHLNYRNHEKTIKHSYSPIVEQPDYTYLDGRPTEMTKSYKEKQEKNYNLAQQVVKLVREVKFAQSQLISDEEAKVAYQQQRQKSRLKEKGGKS